MNFLTRAFSRGDAAQQPVTKRVNLALQGGGAHGAFTWGVLDHLLEDGRIAVDGISGTSAGAVNAVMLADGLAAGGPDEARKRLADFWRSASVGGDLLPVQRAIIERLFSILPLPGAPSFFSAWTGFFSPYDLNPLNINPLKGLIERFVDFERLRTGERDVYVAATNVQTGQLHVFTRKTLSAEAVMASACLPAIFQAVEINGVPYWDGGYLGNPVIFPFFRTTQTEDVLIVQINPTLRKKVPTSQREIMSRVQEISFNASLLVELRAIQFVNRMIDEGRLPRGLADGQYRKIRVHRIVLEGLGERMSSSSRLRNDYDTFELLKRLGRRAARRFLEAHYGDVGERSSVEIKSEIFAGAANGAE